MRCADNAHRRMERQEGAAGLADRRTPSHGVQGRPIARDDPQGGLASPLAPSRRSIPRFGDKEKGNDGLPEVSNTGDDARLLFDGVDGPCSRHRCARTWSLLNATKRGAVHE